MASGKYITEASKVFQKGDEAWHASKYDEAKENYEKAVRLFKQDDDVEGEAGALSRLGELELSLDNSDRAIKVLEMAAELVKNEDLAQSTYGEILIKLSKAFVAKGDLNKALKTIQEAESITSDIGSNELLGDAYDYEAFIYLAQNQDKDALKAYSKATEAYRKERVGLKEASTIRAMARLEMKQKRYDVAHDLLERCRNLYRENGDLLGEASALSAIGTLRYIIRDIENSRKALMKSVYLYGKVSHHFAEAEALLYLARVEGSDKEKGDFERAKAHYKRAIDLFNFLENDVMKKVVLEEYQEFLNRI